VHWQLSLSDLPGISCDLRAGQLVMTTGVVGPTIAAPLTEIRIVPFSIGRLLRCAYLSLATVASQPDLYWTTLHGGPPERVR
jgi:hypothetical protein